ncbi:PH domain-containing protein [Candidatus Peregrinibacteria bacterium]|nr:PH domain-containing protein [Candidatus Peregrinibacteria bacterium]
MFTFPGQRPDEKVLMVIRKHPIVYIRIVMAFIVTAVIPLMIFLILWFRYYSFSGHLTVSISISLMACAFLLIGLLITAIAWLNEEFDLFILTDERLIDITQVSFLKRTVASTPLKQIQDTTSNVDGVLATLLNYGNIEVQTAAGDASKFEIDRVPDPAFIARKILNYARESRGEADNISNVSNA